MSTENNLQNLYENSIKILTDLIGFKTISYYLITSLFAIIIGLGLANTLKPGNSYIQSETTKVYDYSNLNTPDSTLDIFIRMIPTNPISAAANGDMLSIIFFTILLGIAITQLPNEHKKNLTSFFESLLFVQSTIALFPKFLTFITFVFNLKLIPCFCRIFKNSDEISLSIPGII